MSKINLTSKLAPLTDAAEFPPLGTPLVRWGQLLRTTPAAASLLRRASATGHLVPLREVARVRSGVVTRANAYFLVEELPFDKIPNRFRITRRDLPNVAVFLDGKGTPHRIARRHLRTVIKGPDTLIGPSEVAVGPVRLVDITSSPDELRAARDNDTLAYIRRGETVNYNVSADKLKGGIPAERSNIRVRRPFWYSLNVPDPAAGRLVIPEHFDQRFVATALEQGEQAVVIDKLYVVEPFNADHQPVIAAALNSLLTWYQIELRGRTQLGEGVLEAKIPDLEGLLVLDPRGLSDPDAQRLAEAFGPVAARRVAIASEELEREDRELFDCSYLGLAGVDVGETEGARTLLSRELREAMSERRTRTQSVAELKAERTPRQRANRAVDAFAAQIVSDIPPYPDPRHFVSSEALTMPVSITPFEGALTIGSGLFDSGTLFAGSEAVAATEDGEAARFVRAVLTIDPEQTVVDIPTSEELRPALERWRSEVDAWWEEFVVARELVLQQIADDRLRESVARRALELSHASETPETPISEGVSSQVSSRRKARRKARRPPA